MQNRTVRFKAIQAVSSGVCMERVSHSHSSWSDLQPFTIHPHIPSLLLHLKYIHQVLSMSSREVPNDF